MSGIEIDLSTCTRSAETCPIVSEMFERDEFEATIASIDEQSADRRQIFGNFVTACVRGVCPAQDPEIARQIIQAQKNKSNGP